MRLIARITRTPGLALTAVIALAAGGLSGCGVPTPETVTGRVVYRGQPVTVGQVSFLGADGVPVCGDIDPDGSYRVDHVPLGEAAVAVTATPPRDPPKPPKVVGKLPDGRPKVESRPDPTHRPKAPAAVPAKYADARTSGLRLTVHAGPNRFDIDLK